MLTHIQRHQSLYIAQRTQYQNVLLMFPGFCHFCRFLPLFARFLPLFATVLAKIPFCRQKDQPWYYRTCLTHYVRVLAEIIEPRCRLISQVHKHSL